ncbi:hypothetical protein [Streptomyces sp. CB03911]|uniref:hypothetical protein n=1 Tax=Streptomyces sp. CB03911 TaxID=1804758 RepID=UPI0009394165|nr:hypothetical protein [Streptomyces sp. CB03911]OKI19274.1 hypothetical protein A6A07_07170 [Streptomyces sp. CB03911]
MSEYVKDNEGDVWRWDADAEMLVCYRDEDGDLRYDGARRTRAEVTRRWGPLVPCTEDGTPLKSEPSPDDVRALVAGAFKEFAAEMDRAYWGTSESTEEAVYIRARDAAQAVVEGILSGDVKPAVSE